jgi:hypothetical protein
MTATELLPSLRGAKRNGKGWLALCPAHDDHEPSLSVKDGNNGGVVLHCFAGCSTQQVCAALGIDIRELMPDGYATDTLSHAGRIVETYDYTDEHGNLLSQVTRLEPKKFQQRRPDGKGGWLWNLTDVRRVLYRLRELLADATVMIFICEGEKDVDRLHALGLVATTNAGGAGRWRDEYSEALRGRDVCILPDNDSPGRTHAQRVANSLLDVAASVRILALPGLPEKGDVSDWLDGGGTADTLKRLAASARVAVHSVHSVQGVNSVNIGVGLFQRRPMNEWLKDAASKPIPRKLCGDFWAEGELAILFGSTGDGKTAFAVQCGNDIACGTSSNGLELDAEAQGVLYFDFELSDSQQLRRYADDPGDTDRSYSNRYSFANGLERIEVNAASAMFLDADWEQYLLSEVEREIVDSGVKIVIVDNVTWLSRETDKGKFALPLMQRLCELKKRLNLSVLVLAHTPKRDEIRPISLNDLAGSRILANFADAVIAIGKSATEPRVRYLKQLKIRSGEMVYSTQNVAVFQFEKAGNFLGFTFKGCSTESEHLKAVDGTRDERIARACALSAEGRTQREIAAKLGVSVGTVNKYVRSDNSAHDVHVVHSLNSVNRRNTVTGEL